MLINHFILTARQYFLGGYILLFATSLYAVANPNQPSLDILFVISTHAKAYQQVIEQTTEYISDDYHINKKIVLADQFSSQQLLDKHNTLVVALGSKANKLLATAPIKQTVIHSLIPSSSYQQIIACCSNNEGKHYTVFLDQPIKRQAALITNLNNQISRVGVILGKNSADRQPSLEKTLEKEGLNTKFLALSNKSNLGYELDQLFDDIDILLLVPDQSLLNKHNLYTLLLNSYRRNIPVIGFSQSLVKSGALAAVYSAPKNQARQIAELIKQISQNKSTKGKIAFFPQYFDIAINHQVAKSLGMDIPEKSILINNIEEHKP